MSRLTDVLHELVTTTTHFGYIRCLHPLDQPTFIAEFSRAIIKRAIKAQTIEAQTTKAQLIEAQMVEVEA